jgi:hypothetical protein
MSGKPRRGGELGQARHGGIMKNIIPEETKQKIAEYVKGELLREFDEADWIEPKRERRIIPNYKVDISSVS